MRPLLKRSQILIYLSWQLGLKACALYRDGSKLSQPLSNKSDKKKKTEDADETAQGIEAGCRITRIEYC